MVLKVSGLTQKLNQPKPIIGVSDTNTVMVDFDNTSFKEAKYWALKIMKFHRLGGFIMLKSSTYNYHVVFNRPVSWSENTRIMAWAYLISRKCKLNDYVIMQCIKQSSTLRISPKNSKPNFW